MELLPDWSGLVPELLEQIAKRLPLVEDFTAFRGVCTTWRAAVSKNKYQFKVPLLMLAEKHPSNKCKRYMRNLHRMCREKITYRIKRKPRGQKCKIHRLLSRRNKKQEHNHEREFVSLSKRRICARLPFPDAKNKRCLDVGFGWILAVSASKCSKFSLGYTKYGKRSFDDDSDTRYGKFGLGDISDGKVSLVKPFYSCPEIKLPNLTKFSVYKKSGRWPDFAFFIRGALLANPSETSDFTLVLLTDDFIVFWRNGDKNFTVINPDIKRGYYDMLPYKGCIYVMDGGGKIWLWDPEGNDLTKAHVIMQLPNAGGVFHNTKPYLVESTEGELLVILRKNFRYIDNGNYVDYGTNYCKVLRVDLGTLAFEKIQSVGKDAIFIGNNITVAVAAGDYPGILRPNCIYFTDDCHEGYFGEPEYPKGGGKDFGVYDVENKRIEIWFPGTKSFSPINPPMWIFPSF